MEGEDQARREVPIESQGDAGGVIPLGAEGPLEQSDSRQDSAIDLHTDPYADIEFAAESEIDALASVNERVVHHHHHHHVHHCCVHNAQDRPETVVDQPARAPAPTSRVTLSRATLEILSTEPPQDQPTRDQSPTDRSRTTSDRPRNLVTPTPRPPSRPPPLEPISRNTSPIDEAPGSLSVGRRTEILHRRIDVANRSIDRRLDTSERNINDQNARLRRIAVDISSLGAEVDRVAASRRSAQRSPSRYRSASPTAQAARAAQIARAFQAAESPGSESGSGERPANRSPSRGRLPRWGSRRSPPERSDSPAERRRYDPRPPSYERRGPRGRCRASYAQRYQAQRDRATSSPQRPERRSQPSRSRTASPFEERIREGCSFLSNVLGLGAPSPPRNRYRGARSPSSPSNSRSYERRNSPNRGTAPSFNFSPRYRTRDQPRYRRDSRDTDDEVVVVDSRAPTSSQPTNADQRRLQFAQREGLIDSDSRAFFEAVLGSGSRSPATATQSTTPAPAGRHSPPQRDQDPPRRQPRDEAAPGISSPSSSDSETPAKPLAAPAAPASAAPAPAPAPTPATASDPESSTSYTQGLGTTPNEIADTYLGLGLGTVREQTRQLLLSVLLRIVEERPSISVLAARNRFISVLTEGGHFATPEQIDGAWLFAFREPIETEFRILVLRGCDAIREAMLE